jgi:TolB protein
MPSVSPDGKKLAFVRLASGSWANARILTMNTDGTGVKQLTFAATGDGEPQWSPNGNEIVFTCNEGTPDFRDICVMNVDGTGRTAIVTSVGEQETASFSRDGSRIVFQSFGQNPKGRLVSVKPDGTGAMVLESDLDPMAYYSPAWSR